MINTDCEEKHYNCHLERSKTAREHRRNHKLAERGNTDKNSIDGAKPF